MKRPDRGGARPAVVLLGHGSRGTRQGRPFRPLCAWMNRLHPDALWTDAYLSLCGPSLPEAAGTLAAAGVREVRVLPLFLVEGRHVRVDLPAALEECLRRHPSLEFRLSPVLAKDPAVAGLLLLRLGQARAWRLRKGGGRTAAPRRAKRLGDPGRDPSSFSIEN